MNVEELLNNGMGYYKKKDFDRAEGLIEQVLKIEPKNIQAQTVLCSIKIEKREFSNALQLLSSFDEKTKQSKSYWKWMGQIQEGLGRTKEAIIAYKKALEIDSKFEKALILLILLYKNQGEMNQAIKYAREGTINFPTNSYFWQLLNQLHTQQGDYKNACLHILKVISKFGINNEYQKILSSYQQKYSRKGEVLAPIEIRITGKEGRIILDNKKIQSISAIKDLEATRYILTKLKVSNCNLTKIDSLESLTELITLNLSNNIISKIEGLSDLRKLQYLFLSDNNISEIGELEKLPNLVHLFLGKNKIQEISGLENLKKLKLLNLGNNEITKIQGLENLRELNTLTINDNQIERIEGLEKLTKIRDLNLNNNRIREITGLDNLKELEILALGGNQLKSMKGIEKNTQLKFLHLYDNDLEVVSNLENKASLQMLTLKGNKLLPKVFATNFKDFKWSRKQLLQYCNLTKSEVEKLVEQNTKEKEKIRVIKDKKLREQMELNAIPQAIRTKFLQLWKRNRESQCLYCNKKLPNKKNWEEYVRKKVIEIKTEANSKLPDKLRDKIDVELEATRSEHNWQMEGPMGKKRWVDDGPKIGIEIKKIERTKRYAYFFSYQITPLKGTICEKCANEFLQRSAKVFSHVKSTKSPKQHQKMFEQTITNYYQVFEAMVENALVLQK